ncbi:MAG TPA: tetratricopeptide repeat protein [Candidatus Brocadiia bacterium]|nr:tetratricopeptide repeat protein [Candidatus Brocadiales bacterium]
MSLIGEALNKSRNEANSAQVHAYKDGNKRWDSPLSVSILGTVLAGAVVFYYVCNFTNLIPQFSNGKKVEISLKDNVDFASYAKVKNEIAPVAPESVQNIITPPQVQGNELVGPVSSSVTDVAQPTQQEVIPPVEVQTIESSTSISSLRAEGEVIPEADSPWRTIPSLEIALETTSPRNEPFREVETLITEDGVEEEAQTLPEPALDGQSNDDWYAAYHFGMGVFHQKNDEFEEAVEEYNQVIKLDPDNAEVHINLGVIYKDKGDLDKAVEEYEKALAIDPGLEVGHNNLGVVYFIKENYSEAIRHYQKAIEINPKNLESYTNLGIAYGIQKRYDEATRAFQTAISISPRHAETQYNLAVIYDENGEIENALVHYSKFLELYHLTQSGLIDKVKRRMDVLSSR